MTAASTSRLPAGMLAAHLSRITGLLAAELVCPTVHTPEWSDLEWSLARAVATLHGISPLLSKTLLWRGPEEWQQFLSSQALHTMRRHQRIADLLHQIHGGARARGIAAVALKGAELHAMGLYAGGERPMADIDLLVRPSDAEKTVELIESLNYAQQYDVWKERVFRPLEHPMFEGLGEHRDNGIQIDLHIAIMERLPLRITNVSPLIFPPAPQPGLNPYPSKAALLTHLLLHAAGAIVSKSLRILHLCDLARLCPRLTAQDWDEFEGASRRCGKLWWAYPALQLLRGFCPSAVPARILSAAARDCSPLLKRCAARYTVANVSYSYPWIDALPGLEWSQSFTEMFQYAVRRVLPDSALIAVRAQAAAEEVWAAKGQWQRLSQRRRIVRWVISRPTRLPTMYAVRAALGEAQVVASAA